MLKPKNSTLKERIGLSSNTPRNAPPSIPKLPLLTKRAQGLRVPDVTASHRRQVGRPQVRRGRVVAGQRVRTQTVQLVPPRIAHVRRHRGVRAGVQETPVVVRPVGGRVQGQAYSHADTRQHDLWCGSCVREVFEAFRSTSRLRDETLKGQSSTDYNYNSTNMGTQIIYRIYSTDFRNEGNSHNDFEWEGIKK